MTLHPGQRVPGIPEKAPTSKLHAPPKDDHKGPQEPSRNSTTQQGAQTQTTQEHCYGTLFPESAPAPYKRHHLTGDRTRRVHRNTVPQGCTSRVFQNGLRDDCTGTPSQNTVPTAFQIPSQLALCVSGGGSERHFIDAGQKLIQLVFRER